jgi:hypothetical protein
LQASFGNRQVRSPDDPKAANQSLYSVGLFDVVYRSDYILGVLRSGAYK